ncbi:hypothetical protein ACN47E_005096 [Coniothyrium glycines]
MKAHAPVAALAALLVGAAAQTPVSPQVQQSVLLVLATAIPAESVSYALASSSAFAAEMASSLAANNPPSWYQALPSDVKSLLPQIYPGQVDATPTPTASLYSTANSTATPHPSGHNSTSASVSATSSASRSASASSPAFTGAAVRLPTAVIGASVGTILGLLSMFAL